MKNVREDRRAWAAHIEEVRPTMNALAQTLTNYGASVNHEVTRVVNNIPYRAQFKFEETIVTIRFLLKDQQTYSDIVITNVTTLPETQRSQGYGSKAVQSFLQWAKEKKFNEMKATQLSNEDSTSFWEKNGFRKCPPPNPCGDFVYTITGTK